MWFLNFATCNINAFAELLWSYVPVFFYRYAVMLNCWKYESASRPHFVKLYQTMDTYIKTKVCHTASNSVYTSEIEICILPSQLRISFHVNVMSKRINYPAANNLWIQFHHEPMLLLNICKCGYVMSVWIILIFPLLSMHKKERNRS